MIPFHRGMDLNWFAWYSQSLVHIYIRLDSRSDAQEWSQAVILDQKNKIPYNFPALCLLARVQNYLAVKARQLLHHSHTLPKERTLPPI